MNPVLLNIPSLIETNRIVMRPPKPGDGPELNAAILESWENIKDWLPFCAKGKPSLEDSEENVRRAYAKWILREDLRFSVFERSTGKFIGSTGLHRVNWEMPSFEIGYWIRSSFERKGLMSEAVNALTRIAFLALNAKRVELRCDDNNFKSKTLAERLAYPREGTLKKFAKHPQSGELVDGILFARTGLENLPDLQVTW